jgi:hypothetical protein
MRRLLPALVAAAAVLSPVAAAAESATTRIETRPFYGATVTLEEGVRVFRPLPSHDRVIINPGGTTPLSLGYEQRSSVSHNYFYDQRQGASAEPAPAQYVGGVPVYAGPHRRHGHHVGRSHPSHRAVAPRHGGGRH